MPSSKAAAHKKGANGGGKLAVGKSSKGRYFWPHRDGAVRPRPRHYRQTVRAFGRSNRCGQPGGESDRYFVTAFIATSNMDGNKILTGCLCGRALYVLLGFGVFSLIEGQWGSITQLLADLAMGLVIGMLTAMIFSKIFVKQKKPCVRLKDKK